MKHAFSCINVRGSCLKLEPGWPMGDELISFYGFRSNRIVWFVYLQYICKYMFVSLLMDQINNIMFKPNCFQELGKRICIEISMFDRYSYIFTANLFYILLNRT